jgi:2-keto-4-pentenoate hydratase/2-oxohepta-3-ene-1,7-dioic acid hydratase in catechol pathway
MVGRGLAVRITDGADGDPLDELTGEPVVPAGEEVLACHPADLPPELAVAMGVPASPVTLAGAGRRHRLADLDLLAPVVPGKIIAVGLNYRDHAAETNSPIPERPLLSAKYPSAVTGPFGDIHLPDETTQLDYEGELGVVIGRRGRGIAHEHAREHILGYVAGNDVSDRDAQLSDGQWVRGKSYDTFAPFGPGLLVAAPAFDPAAVRLRTWVNGELRQDSHTGQLIFGVEDLVAYASRHFTLEVGDLILTGTPGGVALGMDPPRYLKVGDTVQVHLTGIGGIRNRVVRAPAVL